MEQKEDISPVIVVVPLKMKSMMTATADATLEEVDLVNGSWED